MLRGEVAISLVDSEDAEAELDVTSLEGTRKMQKHIKRSILSNEGLPKDVY